VERIRYLKKIHTNDPFLGWVLTPLSSQITVAKSICTEERRKTRRGKEIAILEV
jgi:hypothetical protein